MEEQVVNSMIGPGTRCTGDIEVDGLVRIDGDFQGSIRTQGKVLIGSTGRVDCVVDARTVVVGGIFRGTLYAGEKVVLLPQAVVMGSIFSPRLVAEEGVILEGMMMISGAGAGDPDVEEAESPADRGRFWFRKPGTRTAVREAVPGMVREDRSR